MRRWASGVSVLTTRREGGIQGITVSSFCSLSLDPVLVVVCIGRQAGSHALILKDRAFAVNVLRAGQESIADRAAGRAGAAGNRLEGVPYRTAATGAPILEDCLAWVDCSLEAVHPGGDHTLFVGRVEAAGHGEGRPLLWFNSGYRTLAPGSGEPPAPRPHPAPRRARRVKRAARSGATRPARRRSSRRGKD